MRNTLKRIGLFCFVLLMLLSFASCGAGEEQTYIDNVTDLYNQIITKAEEVTGLDTTTKSGYNDMVKGIESVHDLIVDLSELDTPDKYSEVQTLVVSSSEKIAESIVLFKAIDLDSEEALPQYEEAYTVYLEGSEIFEQAIEKLEEIHNE